MSPTTTACPADPQRRDHGRTCREYLSRRGERSYGRSPSLGRPELGVEVIDAGEGCGVGVVRDEVDRHERRLAHLVGQQAAERDGRRVSVARHPLCPRGAGSARR